MPRKRKDVIVISKAELQVQIEAAYMTGWGNGFDFGKRMQQHELDVQNDKMGSAREIAERATDMLLKAQQRKPAQTKTPAPSPA